MSVKLLTEHHLQFLALKEGCRGSSGSTLAKIPHCWKAYAAAHEYVCYCFIYRWAINTVEFYEHLGTHIDAPYHGAANEHSSDLQRL